LPSDLFCCHPKEVEIVIRNKQTGVNDTRISFLDIASLSPLNNSLRLSWMVHRRHWLAVLLPVGLKLYKDKDELNFQDISLWSNISIFLHIVG